jgi:site-specific recombinase XerD
MGTVHRLVKLHLGEAGIDTATPTQPISLGTTAATLMLKRVDVRTLQELLGHEH